MTEMKKTGAAAAAAARSCVDCRRDICGDHPYDPAASYPQFCPTAALAEEKRAEIMALYEEGRNSEIMQAAAEVEMEGYCVWPRVEEVLQFAQRLGARRIGIATCVGLIREAGIFADIARSRGFEVYGLGCKVGAVSKQEVGIPQQCNEVGVTMCNPVMQAKLLAEAGTDLNVVIGLCVGHDSLFYRYSEAPATTLVTKDRVTGHNPAAVLYNAKSYWKKLYGRQEE